MIRTTGGAMDLMMRSIGGVPFAWLRPKSMKSLTRGTLDGVISRIRVRYPYDFGKILKSGTEGLNFGTAIFTYSIAETKFKSLPENVRKVLVEAGEQTRARAGKRFRGWREGATEKIKSQGMKVISFGPDDKKVLRPEFSRRCRRTWVKESQARQTPAPRCIRPSPRLGRKPLTGHFPKRSQTLRAGGTASPASRSSI